MRKWKAWNLYYSRSWAIRNPTSWSQLYLEPKLHRNSSRDLQLDSPHICTGKFIPLCKIHLIRILIDCQGRRVDRISTDYSRAITPKFNCQCVIAYLFFWLFVCLLACLLVCLLVCLLHISVQNILIVPRFPSFRWYWIYASRWHNCRHVYEKFVFQDSQLRLVGQDK